MEHTQKSNKELYEERREPPYLKDRTTSKYINLRTTNDIDVLRRLNDELTQEHSKTGIEYVVASWISPPFGIIKGYGVYVKGEAERLSEQSNEERWGFPDFGSIYDKERLERRIKRLEERHKLSLNLAYQD
ncbi:hypothetical protein HY636_00450 [Candidatus Woesearchaeota archaeon]|nr:hypothetical protein [Candidatus Woesearchaeota archaeon]